MQNQNILQALQQLMQKNRVDENVAPPALPQAPAPVQYMRPQAAPTTLDSVAKNGSGTLGFLGGLGDTQNAVTGVADPSILTTLNKYLMNQAGQASGQGSLLPWQQTAAQSSGQHLTSMLSKILPFL